MVAIVEVLVVAVFEEEEEEEEEAEDDDDSSNDEFRLEAGGWTLVSVLTFAPALFLSFSAWSLNQFRTYYRNEKKGFLQKVELLKKNNVNVNNF